MEKMILIKYGELTTKKGNRNFFIDTLVKNIKNTLNDLEVTIKRDRVRMYIMVDNNQFEKAMEKLKKVFGIHGIVESYKVNTIIEDIENLCLELVQKKSFKTFKIETKRADKRFAIKSMDFSKAIGAYILKNSNLKVDVHNPDVLVHIEIREEGTYIYTNEEKGIGGYPVGIQGKGLLMLSGGIDSPVAGYLSLKRGVDLECLYFESPPHTNVEAKNKVVELTRIINNYSGNIKLNVIPFTKIQEEIYKKVPDSYIITIMRRMMYRISEKIALKHNCKIIINGESIGQVASQTLDSLMVINEVTSLPVIRPVACMDKIEIIEIAKKIETYKTSILPYEDCCTIFLPKHPVINPKLEKCQEYEQKINYHKLIDECIDNLEIIEDFNKKNYQDLL